MSVEDGNSLHTLCQRGNIKKVRDYLKALDKESLVKTLTSRSESFGYTPLHEAVIGGNPLIVNLILETARGQGVKVVNVKSNSGSTALHVAAGLDSADCAEVLLQNSADVNAKDSDGRTPFEAVVPGKGNVLGVFWNQGN